MDRHILGFKKILLSKAYKGVEDFNTTIGDRKKELQATLDSLERSIGEEEAILRTKNEKLRAKKASVDSEEESIQKEIQRFVAEKSTVNKQREAIRIEGDEVKLTTRVFGSSFLIGLGVNYRDKPGKVLCPEGKICGSEDLSEVQCNYWECPLLHERMKQHQQMTNFGTTSSSTFPSNSITISSHTNEQKNFS